VVTHAQESGTRNLHQMNVSERGFMSLVCHASYVTSLTRVLRHLSSHYGQHVNTAGHWTKIFLATSKALRQTP